ncbi:PolC-type DNA polymerase III [Holzapfeliella sp. JNUCC 72]
MSKENQLFLNLLNQVKFDQLVADGFSENDSFYQGQIKKVDVYQQERKWIFHLFFPKKISFSAYRLLKQAVTQELTNFVEPELVVAFGEKSDAIDQDYYQDIVEHHLTSSSMIKRILLNAKSDYQNQVLTLKLENAVSQAMITDDVLTELKELLQQYGFLVDQIKTTVIDEAQSLKNLDSLFQQQQQFEQSLEQEAHKQQAAPKKQAVTSSQTSLGNPISPKSQFQQLKDVQEEQQDVVIEGHLFDVEVRSLRNDNKMLIAKLTDYSDSITIKKFPRNQQETAVFENIKPGMWVRVKGQTQNDKYSQELTIMIRDLEVFEKPERQDTYEGDKRAELHLHTTMSQMDATNSIKEYVQAAARFGHKAIAVTDHAGAQAFPEAHAAGKANDVKILYGQEANFVDDSKNLLVQNPVSLDAQSADYVIFDVETTGLSAVYDQIIEIGAVRMKNGEIIERFDEFINPHEALSTTTINLTSITDDMVEQADDEKEVLTRFVKFMSGAQAIAGHNVSFDIGFLNAALVRSGFEKVSIPIIDTLELSRLLHPEQGRHTLDTLSRKYQITLEHHHRADSDAEATGYLLYKLMTVFEDQFGETNLNNYNQHKNPHLTYKRARPSHMTILAKTQAGLKNLFKLISMANVKYYYRTPRLPKFLLDDYREGLLIGSGCADGEVFTAMMQKGYEEAKQLAQYYDYLEIQPPSAYSSLIERELIRNQEDLQDILKNMIKLGEELDKPVVVTGDVHYLNPEDHIYREILISSIKSSPLRHQNLPDLHFRTTQEMFDEFDFLDEQTAYQVIVANPNQIAESTDEIVPVKDKLYTPIMEHSEEEIRELSYNKAYELYGNPLPKIVEDRIEHELKSIIGNGFSVIYLISQKLVYKSNKDGYLVGSRGSVGSSFAATMTGITEVNPLPPHYRCGSCKYSEFYTKGEYGSGYDLPNKKCPNCGEELVKDGHDIPFETFLGFNGDKVPDIDLNFSGDYQPVAHNYTKVLFGEDSVFRAGTIGTVADKTAFGYVKHYEEEKELDLRTAEVERLAKGSTGVKRTTGQHPAGIIVVPDYMDIYDFTPIQYPADDQSSTWKTTHFDFHSIHDNILKLDILGHDDPTMIRMLQDLSGIDPLTIPTNDPGVMALFSGTESIGVTPEQINSKTGTLGVPEFGTKFVRGMLEDTKPTTFAELLQISGLSHGTDVWLGNASDLVDSGQVTLKEVIGCRDNIMLDLIHWGMESQTAFQIMERVRKGKGIPDEWQKLMRDNPNIPSWYIDSCLKIKYMFPKAHATAYVMMALRIAYFKVHYPTIYYAAYFSVRASDFDLVAMSNGKNSVKEAMQEISAKGNDATAKDKSLMTVLELANECLERGIKIKMVDVEKSAAQDFTILDDHTLLAPFNAVPGLGDNVAKQIVAARADKKFLSQEDLATRGKVSKTIMSYFEENGVLEGLPEQNQLSLF